VEVRFGEVFSPVLLPLLSLPGDSGGGGGGGGVGLLSVDGGAVMQSAHEGGGHGNDEACAYQTCVTRAGVAALQWAYSGGELGEGEVGWMGCGQGRLKRDPLPACYLLSTCIPVCVCVRARARVRACCLCLSLFVHACVSDHRECVCLWVGVTGREQVLTQV